MILVISKILTVDLEPISDIEEHHFEDKSSYQSYEPVAENDEDIPGPSQIPIGLPFLQLDADHAASAVLDGLSDDSDDSEIVEVLGLEQFSTAL